MGSIMAHKSRHIKALQRRLDWLTDRIAQSTIDRSYDKAEKAALTWAISQLSGPQEDQNGVSNGYIGNYPRRTQNESLNESLRQAQRNKEALG